MKAAVYIPLPNTMHYEWAIKTLKKAAFSSGMILATDLDKHIDRFEIQGTKESVKGVGFEFNGDGELSFEIAVFAGKKEVRKVTVPQNYRLEVEQFGRCVSGIETPAVTREA